MPANGHMEQETRYGITSLAPDRASSQHLLQLTRRHWGIENGLHYRRDTTLHEDQTLMSQPTQAEVVAVLNNFIIGLARKLGFHNLASAIGAYLRNYL